jgi:hypothetical protein
VTIVRYQVDALRDLPLIKRKRRLARLLGRAKRHRSTSLNISRMTVCRMGLEDVLNFLMLFRSRQSAGIIWSTCSPAWRWRSEQSASRERSCME